MSLTAFQSELLEHLAARRRASGESYVAGDGRGAPFRDRRVRAVEHGSPSLTEHPRRSAKPQ